MHRVISWPAYFEGRVLHVCLRIPCVERLICDLLHRHFQHVHKQAMHTGKCIVYFICHQYHQIYIYRLHLDSPSMPAEFPV